MHTTSKVVPSALFVDFDNVYLGLQKTDEAAAQQFATNPRRWLSALEDGERLGEVYRRRFLIRVCYLNPSTFGRFRGDFARAGFRVVDCPSLTRQGKSGADIHLALDVVDAINHPTTYEEFVICSADADFTPLMVRLRAHDRRTVMVAAGPASSAYEAVCDTVVGAAELADAALGSGSTHPSAVVAAQPLDASPILVSPDDPEPHPEVPAAVAAIRALVAASAEPVPAAAAASIARRAAPDLATRKWGGGGFLAFCAQHLSGEIVIRRSDGGLLVDPRRHRPETSAGTAADDGLMGRIRRLTGAPRLNSAQLRVLFEALADDLRTTPFSLSVTSRRVRDATAERGEPLGRSSISHVLQGVAYRSPESLGGDTSSARDLAQIWRDNVMDHCSTVGLDMNAEDATLVDEWILGGFSGDAA